MQILMKVCRENDPNLDRITSSSTTSYCAPEIILFFGDLPRSS